MSSLRSDLQLAENTINLLHHHHLGTEPHFGITDRWLDVVGSIHPGSASGLNDTGYPFPLQNVDNPEIPMDTAASPTVGDPTEVTFSEPLSADPGVLRVPPSLDLW